MLREVDILEDKKIKEGYALVLLAGTSWGMMGVLTRELNLLGFDSIEIAALRPSVAVIFYLIINLIKDRSAFKTDIKSLLFYMIYGLVALDGMFVAFTYAIEYTSIATASVLLFTNPIMVMIMSYFIFKDKFTVQKVIALFLAVGGCFLIVKGYDPASFKVNLPGIIWGVVSGFTVALQNVLGKVAVKRGSYKTTLLYSFLFAAIFLWMFKPPFLLLGKITSIKSVIFVLGIGFIATVIPNGCFMKALQYIDSSTVSIVSSVEPIVAAILGLIFFKEYLELLQILGMVLIIASVILVQYKKKNKNIKKCNVL